MAEERTPIVLSEDSTSYEPLGSGKTLPSESLPVDTDSEGNLIVVGEGGISATLTTIDSSTVAFEGAGAEGDALSASAKISAEDFNILRALSGGLYATASLGTCNPSIVTTTSGFKPSYNFLYEGEVVAVSNATGSSFALSALASKMDTADKGIYTIYVIYTGDDSGDATLELDTTGVSAFVNGVLVAADSTYSYPLGAKGKSTQNTKVLAITSFLGGRIYLHEPFSNIGVLSPTDVNLYTYDGSGTTGHISRNPIDYFRSYAGLPVPENGLIKIEPYITLTSDDTDLVERSLSITIIYSDEDTPSDTIYGGTITSKNGAPGYVRMQPFIIDDLDAEIFLSLGTADASNYQLKVQGTVSLVDPAIDTVRG